MTGFSGFGRATAGGAGAGGGGAAAAGTSLGPGLGLAITGALVGAVGSFYAAKSQQYQLRSQALSLEFEQSLANLNARQAELDAHDILRAGQQEAGRVTLRAGLARGSTRASQSARGIVGGVGSAAEVVASGDLVKELDVHTINSNAVRAAGQARIRAVNARNRASLLGVSARNIRGTAGTINPGVAAFTSLLGSGASIGSQFGGG